MHDDKESISTYSNVRNEDLDKSKFVALPLLMTRRLLKFLNCYRTFSTVLFLLESFE